MKVSTATTIQELQNRIAAIDYRLNDRTIKLEPKQEEIYWRERVRLMKSLVRLRYAQSQRMVF
jgi:predicted sulfurtransferase